MKKYWYHLGIASVSVSLALLFSAFPCKMGFIEDDIKIEDSV